MRAHFSDAGIVWKMVTENVAKTGSFMSVGGIAYKARLLNNSILYKGGHSKNGEEREICKSDFIAAFESVKNVENINTSTIGKIVPVAMYRKRTPFIGLLMAANIIK